MTELFGRTYRLSVKSGEDELVYEPPMQIRFHVDVKGGSSGATAEITMYGLTDKTRTVIFGKFDNIALSAGYGDQVGLIFNGAIRNIETGREGVDPYIKFYAIAAGREQIESYVSRSWGENTPQVDIIRDVAESMLLPIEFIGDFSDLPPAIKGKVISKPTVTALDELAKLHNFTWIRTPTRLSIIRTLPDGSPASRNTPPHPISAENGMVGSPQILMQGVEVKTLLNPRIRPADTINVSAETRNFAFSGVYQAQLPTNRAGGNGLYTVVDMTHQGDFYGDTWVTSMRGIRPQGTDNP